MDPLSIAASVFSIAQGLESLSRVLTLFKPFFTARRDIATIIDQISTISVSFDNLNELLSQSNELEHAALRQSLVLCGQWLLRLRCCLRRTCVFDDDHSGTVRDTRRIMWVRLSPEVLRLKRQIMETIPVINMQLQICNM
jgi:hypothetical protein